MLIFFNLIISCDQIKENKRKTVEITNNPTTIVTDKFSNVKFSETKGPERIETVILDKKLQIIVLQTYLDSYVTIDDDSNEVAKYKDLQFELIIKQNSRILLDTTIKKDLFTKDVTKDFYKGFLNKSILDYYTFLELNSNKLVFRGRIIDPQKSSSDYEFIHSFDLDNNKLSFSKYENTEDEE
ncbi:DUF4738 domain-containing protein [Pedobacter psychrophilus]|nr:DUF4738 domain-containing protein [Pedobacter psychrophilus]